ncbi:hypothetical protein EYF80_048287 [Liparis tanakae]|uniref:Uncharacterized protein n=1 Tax=Liparis tanakae TaxID=230148 RepID=A0A4Z2FJZ2_9TELE|nr:hypothetical protein EYF80_048287 [Liparis tanakae]
MNTIICAKDSVRYRSAFEPNAVPAAVAVKATSGYRPQTDIESDGTCLRLLLKLEAFRHDCSCAWKSKLFVKAEATKLEISSPNFPYHHHHHHHHQQSGYEKLHVMKVW